MTPEIAVLKLYFETVYCAITTQKNSARFEYTDAQYSHTYTSSCCCLMHHDQCVVHFSSSSDDIEQILSTMLLSLIVLVRLIGLIKMTMVRKNTARCQQHAHVCVQRPSKAILQHSQICVSWHLWISCFFMLFISILPNSCSGAQIHIFNMDNTLTLSRMNFLDLTLEYHAFS